MTALGQRGFFSFGIRDVVDNGGGGAAAEGFKVHQDADSSEGGCLVVSRCG